MDKKNCRRKHQRHQAVQIKPIRLTSSTGLIYFVVPVDESEEGMGCIFSGKNPPLVGHVYMIGDEDSARQIEVRWLDTIANNRYRLGMQYK